MFSSNTRHYEEYANGMMGRGYGYAFLDPPSNVRARPGICGFIDDHGRWQKIVDLKNTKELEGLGLGAFNDTMKQVTEPDRSGPISTSKVSRVALTADVAAAIPGMPAKAGAVSRYVLQGEFGAILVCHDIMERKEYSIKDPFRTWAKANSKLILKKFPDVKKSGGFYVMTSTLTAKDVRITSWSMKGESIDIGASAEADLAGRAGVSGEFYLGNSVTGWHEPLVKKNERNVLFFGGIQMRYHKLWPTAEKNEKNWTGYRGGDEGKFMVDDDEFVYNVEAADIGDSDD